MRRLHGLDRRHGSIPASFWRSRATARKSRPSKGSQRGRLHPLQAAFIEHDAFQCGYCTPGQICSAAGLLSEGHAHSREEIREQMSGNLCRCGAYTNIADAIEDVLARAASREAAE